MTPLLVAAAANKFHLNSFFTGGTYRLLVRPWTCSKVIEDGATYDFLLFYSYFGRICYRFCATVDFMLKW